MQGLPFLLEEETVLAGGLRKSAKFSTIWIMNVERSSDLWKCRGDPGVLGDPRTRIPFLHTGGQERPNCPSSDVGSHGHRGGRQGPSAPVDDHSSHETLTSPSKISFEMMK